MRTRLLLALVLLAAACIRIETAQGPPAPQPRATTRYASASGSGTACTSGSPCSVTTILSQAQCGDTLRFLPGTYSGSNRLTITNGTAPGAINCTSNRVVVQPSGAEGSVRFEGDSGTQAVSVAGVHGWTLEGFNARLGASVIVIGDWHSAASTTSDITLRRVVAWDISGSAGTNEQVIRVSGASAVLVEDVAAFGLGQQSFETFSDTANLTFRRIWSRGEDGDPGVGNVNQWGYGTAPNLLIENAIQIAGRRPTAGGLIYNAVNLLRDNTPSPYTRFSGNIWYVAPGTAITASSVAYELGCTGYLVKDTFVWSNRSGVHPIYAGSDDGNTVAPGDPRPCNEHGVAGGPADFTRVTASYGVGVPQASAGSGGFGPYATRTNFIEASTVPATGFNYVGASNTARLCKQYVNNVYQDGSGGSSNIPLWPWPMDQRIKDAIAANSAAGSVALAGGSGLGYAANTVTSEIVSLLGAIPTACNAAASSTTPNPPAGLTLTQLWRSIWTPLAGMRS